jgi:ubiquinone/menaquinone biosynthesis methyltransferase
MAQILRKRYLACHGRPISVSMLNSKPRERLALRPSPPGLPVEKQQRSLMQEMFATIAPRYDLITHLFSFGMDRRWKDLAVQVAGVPETAVVLDLACGTGDFSRLLMHRRAASRSLGVDITHAMLQRAKSQGSCEPVCADAVALPFPDEFFDCVFVGYGLRNFPNLVNSIREIYRVTRRNGTLVTLDFFLPENVLFRNAYLKYLYVQGAVWGMILHRRLRTYTYIPDSLRSFVSIGQLSYLLGQIGYKHVSYRSFIWGGIGLHWATKS